MRPSVMDRAFVIWIASALVVWTACLVILWSAAFDTSGTSTLLVLAATMWGVSVAVLLPSRAARGAQRVLIWLRVQDVLSVQLARAGAARIGPREGRILLRILGAIAVGAFACGVGSTLLIVVGKSLADRLGHRFLWAPLAWAGLKLLVQLAGMVPMAMALSATFLATALVRVGAGRDSYATICRDWLWAIAAGTLVFALAWLAGANLLGLAFAAGMALLASAVGLFLRREVAVRPVRWGRPIRRGSQNRQELGLLAGFGGLMLAILLQMRFLADVAGAGVPARLAWLALSFGLLARFLGRLDRRSRPPSRSQQLGAVVGVITGLLMQAALAATCVAAGGLVVAACACLIVASQIPTAALAAVILSRQRRLFATGGGRARSYVAAATIGGGAAFVVYVAAFSFPAGPTLLLAAPLTVLAWGVVARIGLLRRVRDQALWAAAGTVLICALAGSILLAMPRGRLGAGTVTPGTWLTSVAAADADGVTRRAGCLPDLRAWRSDALTEETARIMDQQKGRWWVVTSSDLDLPTGLNPGVRVLGSFPDPSAVPPGLWRGLLVPGAPGDFLQAAQTSRERFDGILLAPMPADHPHAWRCYNEQALRRCRDRINPGGLVLIRTQAARGHVAAALAVAKTFHEQIGPGWALVVMAGGRLDLLVVGPADALPARPTPRHEQVCVVATERIWRQRPEVGLLRVIRPTPLRLRRGPSELRLRLWLEDAGE